MPFDPAADSLEWNRLLEYAEAEAKTAPGKTLVRSLSDPRTWAPDLSTARLKQSESQESAALLDRDALWGPLTELQDPNEALEHLSRGATLEIHE